MLGFGTMTAFARDGISVTIDGTRVVFPDQQPVIVNGRTLIPAGGVFEQLGFTTSWDGSTQQVTIANDNYTVVLQIGSALFTVNGARHYLDVPAQIIGGRTMLPIAPVLRGVGFYVDWIAATSTVVVSSPLNALAGISPNRIMAQMNMLTEHEFDITFSNVSEPPSPDDFTVLGLPAGMYYFVNDLSTDGATITVYGTPTEALLHTVTVSVNDMTSSLSFTVDVMVEIGGRLLSTTLTSLELNDLGLSDTDILPLRYLVHLTDLSLNDNHIRDLCSLSELPYLTRLSLSNNIVRDWSPVEHVPNLIRGQQRQSSIILPDRRLTNDERIEWILDYLEHGGPSEFELEVIRLVNEVRQRYGLNLLAINEPLMLAARFYTQTKTNLGLPLGHTEGPYGGSAGTARAFGSSWNTANGARSQATPEAVVDGWMNSPGHRRNILNSSSRSIGVGRYGGFTYMLTTW